MTPGRPSTEYRHIAHASAVSINAINYFKPQGCPSNVQLLTSNIQPPNPINPLFPNSKL